MIKKVITEEEKEKYLIAFNNLYNEAPIVKEVKYLGIILSFDNKANDPRLTRCISYEKFLTLPEESTVVMCGYITDMGLKKSKKGKMYGLLEITDEKYNTWEIMTSDKSYLEIENNVKKGSRAIFSGKKLDDTKISLDKANIFSL